MVGATRLAFKLVLPLGEPVGGGTSRSGLQGQSVLAVKLALPLDEPVGGGMWRRELHGQAVLAVNLSLPLDEPDEPGRAWTSQWGAVGSVGWRG